MKLTTRKLSNRIPKRNPGRAILDALNKGGLTMNECGVAMKLKGCHSSQDTLPYSRIVVSGIGAMVDLEKSGYLSITP